MSYPERIVCLAAETPGILAELSALDRVVGISAYTTYPPQALSITKVSGFQHGSIDRILAQKPDLVILTSGVQAKLAEALGERGATMLHFHPHRLDDLYDHIRMLGAVVGEAGRADALAHRLKGEVESVQAATSGRPRPRVYFEEWMDPLIVGIGWVSDLIEAAGGTDVFRERSLAGRRSRQRVVSQEEWLAAQPDVMLASWCGKPFEIEQVRARPGAEAVPALAANRVHEVDATILQCGVKLVERLHDLSRYLADAAV
jgi:iron complex transport system substrate-binding protein